MSVTLVRLDVSNELSIRNRTGDRVTSTEKVSESGLRADLILSGDGDPDLNQLGFVRVHIEAQPRNLPPMTPDQTLDWLRERLKKML